MSDPHVAEDTENLAPVRAAVDDAPVADWTSRLVLFLRLMAALSLLKGLRHWAALCGFAFVPPGGFESQPISWQAASVFFAVIDMVAAVGLWLAAPWGAVVWLTSSVSMIVVAVFFPQIYDNLLSVLLLEPITILGYLALAVMAAREQPQ